MIHQVDSLLNDFIAAARLAEIDLLPHEIRYECLPCLHMPPKLLAHMQAVYVFSLPTPFQSVLKVGKVSPHSTSRFFSHHYDPESSQYNLAKSLLSDAGFWQETKTTPPVESQIGEWIKQHVDRENFYLSAQKSRLALSLMEIFFQCRLQPRYEGYRVLEVKDAS